MKRLISVVALVLVFSITLFGTASAAVNSISLDDRGDLSASKTAIVVSGTINCTVGHDVNIQVIITQSSGKVDATGTGTVDIVCSGLIQTWSATVNVLIGEAFKKGPAIALFGAFDNTDGNNSQTFSQGIKIG